jgi:two-component system, cell cycle sensor histidine kinase and response regulator CckA
MLEGAEPDHLEYIRELEARLNAAEEALRALRNGRGDGEAPHRAGVLNISDIKRVRQEDLARQKLESVGTLASGIAHDFNNLLGSVLASTELALAEVDDGQSPAENLHRIRDVAVRGAEIVRQLMIYAGEESPVCESVDISSVVDEMVELLKISTGKQVTLKTSLGKGLPPVPANPAQIRQVVMNLVINAAEAIGEGSGVIEVATSKVAIGRSDLSTGTERLASGDYVRLSVSDTGRGMTQAEQSRIFDPFFTTKTAGHGLGLAVVQGIVRILGGAIRLVSTPRRGTTFRILLPCACKTVAERAKQPTTIAAKGQRLSEASVAILVIEDEDTLRNTVSKLLRKAGHSVMQAENGSTGLDLLRMHSRDVSVMLLDVSLPGMPSREVLRQARHLVPDLKVILTSAYSEERVTASFAGAKFDGFVRKPYRLADLTAALR